MSTAAEENCVRCISLTLSFEAFERHFNLIDDKVKFLSSNQGLVVYRVAIYHCLRGCDAYLDTILPHRKISIYDNCYIKRGKGCDISFDEYIKNTISGRCVTGAVVLPEGCSAVDAYCKVIAKLSN